MADHRHRQRGIVGLVRSRQPRQRQFQQTLSVAIMEVAFINRRVPGDAADDLRAASGPDLLAHHLLHPLGIPRHRSAARRVGKECVSTVISRWSRSTYKKK